MRNRKKTTVKMRAFPLPQVFPNLLEKVVAKCNASSYSRLQQTCRDMKEFIEKSPKMRIPVVVEAYLVFKKEKLLFQNGIHGPKPYPISALHGFRLNAFKSFYLPTEDKLPLVCDALKKHRITAKGVVIWDSDLATAQWLTLFGILKPVKIYFNKREMFETVLQLKTLKHVKFSTDSKKSKDLSYYATKLFSTFPKAKLMVQEWERLKPIYRTIFDILQRGSFSADRNFNFSLCGFMELPSQEELEKKFPCFNWVTGMENRRTMISAVVELPGHFPKGSTCEIVLKKPAHLQVNVYYEKGNE